MTTSGHQGPSPHLAWAELACRDGTGYPREWRATRAAALGIEFERIRAAVGTPICVLSAYRTPDHNRRVGGARNSQHCQGRALDLQLPRGWTMDRFYRIVREIAGRSESLLAGLGRYPAFVHIDIPPLRADGRLTAWRGSRAWAEAP